MKTFKRRLATECGGEGGKPGPCPEQTMDEGHAHGVGGKTHPNLVKGRNKLNKGNETIKTRKLTDYQQQTITDLAHISEGRDGATTPRFGNDVRHGEHGTATMTIIHKDPKKIKDIVAYANTHGMEVTISKKREDGSRVVSVHAPMKELTDEQKGSMKLYNAMAGGDETATRALADKLEEAGSPLGAIMQRTLNSGRDDAAEAAGHIAMGYRHRLGSIFAVEKKETTESVEVCGCKKKTFKNAKCVEEVCCAPRVDRKKGIIYDALLLGNKKRNKRRYTREAREDALARGIYEGLSLYIGPHKKGRFAKRSPNNHAGELQNIRLLDNNEIRCDILVNRATRGGRLAMEIAERFPNRFGLSHHSWIDGYEEGGEKVVTAIAEVAVADLVKDPGTTDGVFEDVNMPEEALEEEGLATMPEEPETEEGGGDWASLMKQLIGAIHDDDSLDDAVKLKATKDLMKLKATLNGGEEEPEETEEEPEAEESVDFKAILARLDKLEKRPAKVKIKSSARVEATESTQKTKTVALPTTRDDVLKMYDVVD